MILFCHLLSCETHKILLCVIKSVSSCYFHLIIFAKRLKKNLTISLFTFVECRLNHCLWSMFFYYIYFVICILFFILKTKSKLAMNEDSKLFSIIHATDCYWSKFVPPIQLLIFSLFLYTTASYVQCIYTQLTSQTTHLWVFFYLFHYKELLNKLIRIETKIFKQSQSYDELEKK